MVADGPLVLPRALVDQLIAHARGGLPNEACGILAGRDGRATRFLPAVNGEASPYFYSIEAQDLLRIVLEVEDAEEEIVAALKATLGTAMPVINVIGTEPAHGAELELTAIAGGAA